MKDEEHAEALRSPTGLDAQRGLADAEHKQAVSSHLPHLLHGVRPNEPGVHTMTLPPPHLAPHTWCTTPAPK